MLFSETIEPIKAKFYMLALRYKEIKIYLHDAGHMAIIVCSNDGTRVTLTYFYGQVKFENLAFSIGKVTTVDFSETIAASDLKVVGADI